MSSKNRQFLANLFSWLSAGMKKPVNAYGQKFCSILLFSGIALVLSITLVNNAIASENEASANYDNIDARLLPWVGTWRLVSDKVNTNESSSKQEYLLTIKTGSNDDSIIMKGYQGEKVLIEEEIIADGLHHPLNDKKCSGYYEYTWSETGKRLLLNSETNCPGDTPRRVSGMSIIDSNRDWLDIQLLQNGTEKAVSIRKYRNVDNDSGSPVRFNPDKAGISRIAAGKNFSIDEIIELSSKVEPEIIEAALLESRDPFPINSRQLARLSDSGVNSRVVDLMVAFSFPDKFKVGQEAISLTQVKGPQGYYPNFRRPYNYYSYYCPILPWHWTSSSYMSYVYSYSYLGWYLGDGYYYPLWSWYPYYYDNYSGGGGGGHVNVNDGGSIVKGRGYTVSSGSSGTSTRRAQPRSAPVVRSAPVQSSSSSYSGGSSGSTGVSGSTGSSSRGTPSASPHGYSSGRQ